MVTKLKETQITGLHCRMARAGLGLGMRDLAELADVSPNTVVRFERGESMHRRTVKTIQASLEDRGAEFIVLKDGQYAVAVKEG